MVCDALLLHEGQTHQHYAALRTLSIEAPNGLVHIASQFNDRWRNTSEWLKLLAEISFRAGRNTTETEVIIDKCQRDPSDDELT